MRTHKVGTLTLGISLIFFGVLFLIHLFGGVLSYSFIFHLWPVIFLLLGVEILLSTMPKTGTAFKLDVQAVILLTLLILFAMCMAGADVLFQSMQQYDFININF